MKTNFETEEDIWFLRQILMRASMTTENLFDMHAPELHEYRDVVIKTRAKIFEYLGEADINQGLIDKIQSGSFAQLMGITDDIKQ